MSTYNSVKILIESGNYQKNSMTTMLNLFLTFNQITAEQYEELMNLINEGELNEN